MAQGGHQDHRWPRRAAGVLRLRSRAWDPPAHHTRLTGRRVATDPPASGTRGCRSPQSGSRARSPMTRSTRRGSTPRVTSGPGRDSGCPASSTRRSSTALTEPTRQTDRPTLTPTSQRAHQQPPRDAHLPPRGRCSGPRPPKPSGAPGGPCSGWPPTPADDAGEWFVERRPDGATWQPGTHLTRRLPLTDREATQYISLGRDGYGQTDRDRSGEALPPRWARRCSSLNWAFRHSGPCRAHPDRSGDMSVSLPAHRPDQGSPLPEAPCGQARGGPPATWR
jgi:hypothetical protein